MAEHHIIVARTVWTSISVPGTFDNRKGEVAEVRLLANRGEYDALLDEQKIDHIEYEVRYVCTTGENWRRV